MPSKIIKIVLISLHPGISPLSKTIHNMSAHLHSTDCFPADILLLHILPHKNLPNSETETSLRYQHYPEDYLGTWRSENGRVKIKIKKLSQKSVTFTYWQTNKKKTASCKAKVKKSVAGNATRFSFTDSLGNVAKGYLTFDNGRLYVNIKTKTKAEGAKVHPSVDTVMIKE